MNKMKSILHYFSKWELVLWSISVALIIISYILFDRKNYLTLFASVVGATSLIFNARGNPLGQVLIVVFSVLYGIISFTFAYYGEMITYLGMTAPMAVVALIAWIKNPYENNRAEVKINYLKKSEFIFMFILSAVITVIFYFILKIFETANIIPSTVSVTTSFIAVYLTFRRSEYFALAYALNDIVLIVLWILASINDISYISVVVCFGVFLINDIYGYISWREMKKRQSMAV